MTESFADGDPGFDDPLAALAELPPLVLSVLARTVAEVQRAAFSDRLVVTESLAEVVSADDTDQRHRNLYEALARVVRVVDANERLVAAYARLQAEGA